MWCSAIALVSVFLASAALADDKCELKKPSDCLQAGLELLDRDPPDTAAALPWVAKACVSKVPDGCAQLGFMYMGMAGIAADDAKAYGFSAQACTLGSGLGCMNAAVMTRDGKGTAMDIGAAIVLFEKACTKDNADACEVMGWVYWNGEAPKAKDEKKALTFHERSCKLGNGKICNTLGVSYLNGEPGIAIDRNKALAMFVLGCKAQYQDSCDNQKLVEGQLAPAASGKVEAVLGQRAGKRVNIKVSGAAPPLGAVGDVSKQIEQAGFSMWLVIGRAKVVKVTGVSVELEVLEEKSAVVVDGKKVDHWTSGSALTFEWEP